MTYKLEKIKSLLPTMPYLKRLSNYVALQIKNKTPDIKMKPLVSYDESMTTFVDQKLNSVEKEKMDCESDVSNESKDKVTKESPAEKSLYPVNSSASNSVPDMEMEIVVETK